MAISRSVMCWKPTLAIWVANACTCLPCRSVSSLSAIGDAIRPGWHLLAALLAMPADAAARPARSGGELADGGQVTAACGDLAGVVDLALELGHAAEARIVADV